MRDLGEPQTVEGIWMPRRQVTIAELYNGRVPEQSSYAGLRTNYHIMAAEPLVPFVRKFGDRIDVIASGPAIRGKRLQELFSLAAPSKLHGVDHKDTQEDWRKLFEDPNYAGELQRHQGIHNWKLYFEPYRQFLVDFIQADYFPGKPDDVIVPVLRIRQEGEKLQWDLRNLDEDEQTMLRLHTGSRFSDATFLPVLGPLFVAAFSPAVTYAWGAYLNYHQKPVGTGQDMGATQAFALSLALADGLLDRRFIKAFMEYCSTGIIPTNHEFVRLNTLTPDELRNISLPDHMLDTVSVNISTKGNVYKLTHFPGTNNENPGIHLKSSNRGVGSVRVREMVAQVSGARSYTDFGLSTVKLHLPRFISAKTIADFVEGYKNHYPRTKIEYAIYQEVLERELQELPIERERIVPLVVS